MQWRELWPGGFMEKRPKNLYILHYVAMSACEYGF